MQSILNRQILITFLALMLSAVATPTWAIEDIAFCDEINRPGSYRVTQDLSCRSCPQCLLIDASNVTIDLQGHSITGDGTTGAGITVPRNSIVSNVAVRNGTVASFGDGIDLGEAKQARVEHMRVLDNSIHGIVVGAQSAVVSNLAARNGRIGILTRQGSDNGGSLVIENVAAENGATGISVGFGGVVRNNSASLNGLEGIRVLCPSSVSDNAAFANNRTRPGLGYADFFLKGGGCAAGQNAPSTQ